MFSAICSPSYSLHSTVESIRQQLDVCPVLTQLPLGSGKEFHGVVDLVQMQALVWPQGGDGRSFSPVSLDTLPLDTQRDACQWRELLVEQVLSNTSISQSIFLCAGSYE